MMATRDDAPTGLETVAEWRREVLQKAFAYMFALLAVLLLVEVVISLQTTQWHALPALTMGVVLQGIAAFARFLSIRARGAVFTAAACLGLGFGLPTLGFGLPIPFVIGGMTLTLLALCVGERFALGALASIVSVMLAAALFVCFFRSPLPVELGRTQTILDPNRFSNWLRVIVVFTAVGVALIGAVGFLVRRLEEAVARNRSLFVDLEKASRERIHALEERQVLQAKLRRSGELQVMGMLSATVAHDFNNLLMVIMGNAASLKTMIRGEVHEELADIEQAVARATDLCRRLLTLAGERTSEDEIGELNQLVEGELSLLRRLVTSRVTLEWNPGPPSWLKCARTELRQALHNLCANARDAMPKGGKLRIATSKLSRARPGKDTPLEFACLVVTDSGTGMDAATREKIFEPFFTTKDKAQGTGLGMSVVAAAVEHHNGFLELESAPGQGTTFSLFLPIMDGSQREPPRAPTGVQPRRSQGERVIVVDDDEGARKIVTRYLEENGYVVQSAPNGEEALALLQGPERVDIIVSDAVMPGMNGRALYDIINRERPDLPFLFCSGFSANSISLDVLSAPHRALLAKPFSKRELLTKVRELLDAGATNSLPLDALSP